MRRKAAVLAACLGVLALSGCEWAANGQSVDVVTVQDSEGNDVDCAVASSGGIDCDWSE